VTNESSPMMRCVLVGLACAVIGSGAAQSVSPFFADPMLLSRAFGLELIAARLAAVEALDGDYGEYLEQVEKLLGRDIRRFEGTLLAADPDLADELRQALAGVIDAVAEGGDVDGAIARARDVQARAYDVLIDVETRESLPFTAMVLADLLLQDDGVAEAYEDAAEDDLWEYPTGYGALLRVKQIWEDRVADRATSEQREDVEEMFAFLDEVVYPSARPPDEIRGDPEEAEAATQRITGVLESIAGADLYPSRDLGRLAESLVGMLEPTCAAYREGAEELGVEGIYAVRNPYRKHLRRLLDLVAPEIHEPAAAHLDALIGDEPPEDRAAACVELRDLLIEAGGVL
jgi:hypothetical protein